MPAQFIYTSFSDWLKKNHLRNKNRKLSFVLCSYLFFLFITSSSAWTRFTELQKGTVSSVVTASDKTGVFSYSFIHFSPWCSFDMNLISRFIISIFYSITLQNKKYHILIVSKGDTLSAACLCMSPVCLSFGVCTR